MERKKIIMSGKYVCPKCGDKLKSKQGYDKHLMRKIPCIKVDIPMIKKDPNKKPELITIGDNDYYNGIDLMMCDPLFFKGCINSRKILERKEMEESQYIYAKNVGDNWTECDKDCRRVCILLSKDYVEKNIPKMMERIEDINKMYDTEMAPPVLDISDGEKFKDSDGNVLDIEIRGERKHNKCYFRVDDVSKHFNIKIYIRH
jgi:hypothetical protein